MVKRKDILEEAQRIVDGERENQYGRPENNFSLIAKLWTSYLGVLVSPEDVAVMMILLKSARIKSGNSKSDNWIDICGYAACGGEIDSMENDI